MAEHVLDRFHRDTFLDHERTAGVPQGVRTDFRIGDADAQHALLDDAADGGLGQAH